MRQQPFYQQQQMRQQPFQQQQQQQQYVHRQQQHQQPYQQQYVRPRQQLLQPHHSSHHASPKWGIGGAFECGSNARGWYQEESPPRPTLRWAAYTSASGVEDSGIWPRFVPFYSGSKVHATAVASMITATTTASPTSTTHTPMTTSLAI